MGLLLLLPQHLRPEHASGCTHSLCEKWINGRSNPSQPFNRPRGPDCPSESLDRSGLSSDYRRHRTLEKTNGTIPDDAIVLFKTGYEQFYPDRKKYFSTSKTGPEAIPELHFPGILPDTTQWLPDKRNIKALGFDPPSMDYEQSKAFKTHQILLGHNKPGFENLTPLNRLPATGIYAVALPVKIAKGSGGPLRIIATAFFSK